MHDLSILRTRFVLWRRRATNIASLHLRGQVNITEAAIGEYVKRFGRACYARRFRDSFVALPIMRLSLEPPGAARPGTFGRTGVSLTLGSR
jgi:hypothetical protein